jgi:hypothetical protein
MHSTSAAVRQIFADFGFRTFYTAQYGEKIASNHVHHFQTTVWLGKKSE